MLRFDGIASALCCLAVLGGCSDDAPSGPSNDGGGGEGGADEGGGAPMRMHAAGTLTWTLHFDAEAVQAGARDCSYGRSYDAVEDVSAPWLCPSCERTLRAGAAIAEAERACYDQVFSFAPAPVEWLGWQGDRFYRGKGDAMTEQGSVVVSDEQVSVSHQVTGLPAAIGGHVDFTLTGSLDLDWREGDARHGFVPPDSYACGWPKSDLHAYQGDYALSQGAVMPDGILKDVCDEPVRLHDFAGSYLVVVMSAFDCAPCQQMASEEHAFIDALAAQGIEVKVITLLAPSLADTLGPTPVTLLQSWTGLFGETSPVLADRGWGVSMFYPVLGLTMAYPSWMVVAPDLRVLGYGAGYDGYAEHEALIAADG